MRWRSFMVLALVVSEGSWAAAAEVSRDPVRDALPGHALVEREFEGLARATLPAAARAVADNEAREWTASHPPLMALDTVMWTVPESMPVNTLCHKWGLRGSQLAALNPGLGEASAVQAGARLVVFRRQPDQATESIGVPHHGRLAHGIPMPEGEHWRLRDRRIRAYGAEGTVRSLVEALTVYGRAHADGPPIHIGELSYRKGGRAWPHVSHRTGRDVDIGYVMKPGVLGERHWARADEETLDVERTWTLIKALGDTGRVQRMFVSSRLQRVIKKYALTVATKAEVGTYFRTPGAGASQRYLITHENGHRDHLHVRFRCDADDRRCAGHGLFSPLATADQ